VLTKQTTTPNIYHDMAAEAKSLTLSKSPRRLINQSIPNQSSAPGLDCRQNIRGQIGLIGLPSLNQSNQSANLD
jgi:hypothetical protein